MDVGSAGKINDILDAEKNFLSDSDIFPAILRSDNLPSFMTSFLASTVAR